MVYKKYVYKKGKKFGPYYYESYRVGNQVKKRYIGTSLPSPIWNFFKSRTTTLLPVFLLIFILGVILLSQIIPSNILGKVIIQEDTSSEKGSSISIPEETTNQEPEEKEQTISIPAETPTNTEEKTSDIGIPETQEPEEEIPEEDEEESIVIEENLNESSEEVMEEKEEKLESIVLLEDKTPLIGILASPLSTFNGSFFDGFESGTFATNQWEPDTNWVISTTNTYAGTYKADESVRYAFGILTLNLSTVDYQNITFSYWASTGGTFVSGGFNSSWWNGTTWKTLMTTTSLTTYTFYTFNLTSDANNNPNFKIRFICQFDGNTRHCYLDNVNVTGKVILSTGYPVISNVNATNITNQSAIITWSTNITSNTSVNYGTTISLGTFSGINDVVTAHSRNLTGLMNKTLYYYNVTSCSYAGNCTTNGTYNFTTPQNAMPPTVSDVVLSSTFGTNTISENLTVSFVASDPNDDPIYNITDWRINGSSIAVLNMPSEGGSNATQTKDYSTFNNNGIVLDAAWNSTAGYGGGGAYWFNGVNSLINITDSPSINLTSPFTISLWAKTDSTPEQYDVLAIKTSNNTWTDGYGIFFDTGPIVSFYVNAWNVDVANASITPTQWNHIVGVYNGTSARIFVNGVEGTLDNNIAGTTLANNANLQIGVQGSAFGFSGFIDNIVIYNRSLSVEQIRALYNNRTDRIVSQELQLGQNWTVAITPNDRNSDGNTVISNSLLITTLQNNTAPRINLSFPLNNTQFNNTQNINFNFTVYDNENTILNCLIYLDNSLNQTNSTTRNGTLTNFLINGINYGNHNWSINCSDGSLRNVSELRYFSINDTIPPIITINSPLNQTYSTTITVFNVTINENGFCIYSMNAGAGNWSMSTTDNRNFNATNTTISQGSSTVTYYCNDTAGNLNKTNVTFLIDSISPTINFTAPTEASDSLINTRNNIVVNVTANDTNLANITIYLFNSTRGVINTTSSSTSPYFVNFTNLANELYYFNATATDSLGNSNSTETRNVTINYDVTAPAISIAYPQNTTYSINISALNYTYSDANPGYCWYSRDNGATNSSSVTAGINFTSVTSMEGSNIWTLYCNDTSGNKNSSSVTFSKDTEKPLWSNPSINETTIYNGIYVKFNATWTDANLAGYIFSIKQNGTYWNSSYILFSGTTNVSENISLIVAPAGTNVTWFFWANDTNGNANQTSLQSFVVQTRNSSLLFSVNQTMYPQGKSPVLDYNVYIPFQARYLDNNGQPISGATCNVTNDETSDITPLTYNTTTGNYTGNVTTYMMYDVVTFNVSCSKTNYVSAINNTSTNVWFFFYASELGNMTYGVPNYSTTHWLRKNPPTGNVYTLSHSFSLVQGLNEVPEGFISYGAGPLNSILKNINFIGTVTLRLNLSMNDSTCKPLLCFHVLDNYLNDLYEQCGQEQTIIENTSTLLEQNITVNLTVRQGQYIELHPHFNCSSAVQEQVTDYYNYTGQSANIEIHHAQPFELYSQIIKRIQPETNPIIGPNSAINFSMQGILNLNNVQSLPLSLDYWLTLSVLPVYPNSLIANEFYAWNSTGQLWASDNLSAGAPYTATIYPNNQIHFNTEVVPASTAINMSLQMRALNAIRDAEALSVNTSAEKQWQINLSTIFISQLPVVNVTAWTNYSTYGVPDDWEISVNMTLNDNTTDITSNITIDTNADTITFPATNVYGAEAGVKYTVTAKDKTPPTVHLISPANGTLTNQSSQTFLCNITNIIISNLTLLIWNSTGNQIYLNTTSLTGVFNETSWQFNLPYDNSFKWNCLGYDSSGNSNWSSEGNYTITLDTTSPYVSILSPLNQTYFNPILINLTNNSDAKNVWWFNGTANLTYNQAIYYNFSEGSHTIYAYANDTIGNLNSTSITFNIIVSSPPSVVIFLPDGTSHDEKTAIGISTNITDSDGINTTKAMIILPNGNNENVSLCQCPQKDSFDLNTIGTYWIVENSSVGPGQKCIADIDTTVSNQAFNSLSGDGSPNTDTYCSLVSRYPAIGNFDMNVSFNITSSIGKNIAINLKLTESPTFLIGKNMLISWGNWTGYNSTMDVFMDDGNISEYISSRDYYESNGKFRIKRQENNFTFYSWNNTADNWHEEQVAQNTFEFSRVLYIILETETTYPGWGTINVSWDNLETGINPDLYMGVFNNTLLDGLYNLTIYASDSLGAVNNSEKANFTILFINNRPSSPSILAPTAGEIIRGVYNITWSQVYDKEQDSLQFNITLLNASGTYNSTIVSNYGNSNSTKYVWNTNAYTDGLYDLRVLVFENATPEGNSNSYTLGTTFEIDNTPPAIQFVPPTETSGTILDRNYFLINVTANDTHLSQIYIRIYDSSKSFIDAYSSMTSPAYFNFNDYEDGLYFFNATSTDTLGNSNSTETRNITLDTQFPVIYVYNPLNQTYGVLSILVNFSASDTSLDKLWYYNESANVTYTSSHYITLSGGSHTFIFYANDTAGNLNQTSRTFLIISDVEKPKVYAVSPANNAVDVDGNLTFNCSATDNTIVDGISLYFNGIINQTNPGVYGSSVSSLFNIYHLGSGNYNWSCYACDDSSNCNQSETKNIIVNKTAVPTYNTTYFSGNTTDWNEVEDITNVCNGTAILENTVNGLIQWQGCINAQNANFDNYVIIGYNNITVNFGLNLTFNSSAKIEIRNLTWDATPIILRNGVLCPEPECSNVTYNSTTGIAIFNVSHFTSYITSGNSQMTIWDETDSGMPYSNLNKTQNEQVKFFANYSRSANNQPITAATCTIRFSDSTGTMSYNSSSLVYDYNRSFTNNGTFTWNVTCSRPGFQTLTTNDTVIILADTISPSITNLVPSAGASHLVNSNIEISADAYDNSGISSMKANITLPNSTTQTITLSNVGGNKYNNSYAIPENLTGQYNITFIANDTFGNINSSESTYFIASLTLPPTTPVSGGGGGARAANFELDKDLIEVSLFSGEASKESLTVKNTGSKFLTISGDAGFLSEILMFSEKSFELAAGESKTLILNINSIDILPFVYSGKISFTGDGVEKGVDTIINIKEKAPLFEVFINLTRKSLLKGEEIEADIKLTRSDGLDNNVNVSYYVRDFDNKVLLFESESIKIDKEIEIKKKFKLPEEIVLGNYMLYAEISYGNITSRNTEVFSVLEKERPLSRIPWKNLIIGLSLIIVIVLVALIISYRRKHLGFFEKIDTGEIKVSTQKTVYKD